MSAPAPIRDPESICAWLRQVAPQGELTADSRTLAAGDVFLAYAGGASDGRRYIADALGSGARAVLFDAGDGFAWDPAWSGEHLAVPGLKALAGPIAALWQGNPDADMFTIAVTGTNGKTSCSQWLARSLSRQGEPAAVIGTLGNGMYQNGLQVGLTQTGLTTPDAITLQAALAGMRDAGAKALAIEASSIGLHQGRLNGMHIDLALFTNLTRDHLDYHGDMEAYEAAKRILFDWPGLTHAVINLDDACGRRLAQHMQQRASTSAPVLIGYTREDREQDGIAVLRARDVRVGNAGIVFQLSLGEASAQVRTQIIGDFNVSNMLGVAGALLARGIDWEEVVELLEDLEAVPGRMQQFGGQDAPLVVIDYAHTPDALEKAITSLQHVLRQRQGKLWCVFGCGGDRDPGKRAHMGAVASQNCDHVVITSDNPRSEDPAAIIAQISAGVVARADAPGAVQEIEDRAAAILWAVKHAARSDVLLVAGKGHEEYQEIRGRKLPFRDVDHAALALAARATMKGGL